MKEEVAGLIDLKGNLKRKSIIITINSDFNNFIVEATGKNIGVSYPKQLYGEVDLHVLIRDDVLEPITIEIWDRDIK